ncbi:MAG: preprotein translocase subunit SecE [Candidatus Acidiferrales bacterium]
MKDQTIRGGGEGGGSGAIEKLGEQPRRLRQFLHEVRVEMDKVSWPSWPDVRSTTIVVIVTVALFGLFFMGTDAFSSRFVIWLIEIGKKL